jgi:hypothetical protein
METAEPQTMTEIDEEVFDVDTVQNLENGAAGAKGENNLVENKYLNNTEWKEADSNGIEMATRIDPETAEIFITDESGAEKNWSLEILEKRGEREYRAHLESNRQLLEHKIIEDLAQPRTDLVEDRNTIQVKPETRFATIIVLGPDFQISYKIFQSEKNPEEGPQNFRFKSLSEVAESVVADPEEWQIISQSREEYFLKRGGDELLHKGADGKKISVDDSVKGSGQPEITPEILTDLYSQGFSIMETTAKELCVYFADEKGRVSYEVYQFVSQPDITMAEPSEIPMPASGQSNQPSPEPAYFSPTEPEPIVISLDKFMGNSENNLEAAAPVGGGEALQPQADEFNFQEFFGAQPRTAQAAENFGIKLILDEPVKTGAEFETELARQTGYRELPEKITKEPLRGEVVEPAASYPATTKVLDFGTDFREVITGEVIPALEKSAGQVAPATQAIPPPMQKNIYTAKTPALKIGSGEEIVAQDEQKYVTNIKAEPERQHYQTPPGQTSPGSAPVVKFYHGEPLIVLEPETIKPETITTIVGEEAFADKTEPKLETPTLKIDIGREIITKDEPEEVVETAIVEEITPKSAPDEEKTEAGIQKVSLKTIKLDQPPRIQIKLEKPLILPDRVVQAQQILESPRAEVPQEEFYDFLEQRAIIPAKTITPVIIKNKASANPLSTLEILQRITPPRKETAIIAPTTAHKDSPAVDIKAKTFPRLLTKNPAEIQHKKPAEPNLLQQITLLSSPDLKTASPSPANLKVIPIKQNIFTAEAQIQRPRPAITETNSRRAIPPDQIIDEKNNGTAARGQALQIAA